MTKVDRKAIKWSGKIVTWGRTWTVWEDTASDSECNRTIDEVIVMNVEPVNFEDD